MELSGGGNGDNSQHTGIINEVERGWMEKHVVETNMSIFTYSILQYLTQVKVLLFTHVLLKCK